MTAAGLAFIAGGLATLINFRAVLFGGGGGDGARDANPARRGRSGEPPRTASRAGGCPRGDEIPVDNAPGRGRRRAAAFNSRVQPIGPDSGPADAGDRVLPRYPWPEQRSWHGERSGHGGKAWQGDRGVVDEAAEPREADEQPEASRFIDNTAWRAEPAPDQAECDASPDSEPPGWDVAPAPEPPGWDAEHASGQGGWGTEPASGQAAWSEADDDSGYDRTRPAPIDRSDRRYGDRIDDWVRPRYRDLDDQPPSGDYWTPVPDDLYADPEPSARGYGWPVPVERLPAVPDYEPATGFDLTPVQAAEPTTLMPAWTPPEDEQRIRLPRSWAMRDARGRSLERTANGSAGREEPSWNDPSRRGRRAADAEARRERGRPRPRPRPAAVEADSSYVSRHAAHPQR
ncbi:hypothetical protein [Actinoplanes siamensis]|uniref:Uncharacterized protein n=1 Tax=Actinoplanes siamensis TaxID=1223317 RepID=A0A919N8S2_9ACTN|nr:hypothetical protein [Actinoplanes siamensis]GIF06390.1 hypothetical protein Asi03nite_39280 [Actinoplanes siamensis]